MTDAYKAGREAGIREAAALVEAMQERRQVVWPKDILSLLDAPAPAPAMRLETVSENIARDMREGRFPERTPPQMVAYSAAAPAGVTVQEAAKVLLSADKYMPEEAKQAALGAHLAREGVGRPVAIAEAWRAALRALSEDRT